jgi:hypothetical protein
MRRLDDERFQERNAGVLLRQYRCSCLDHKLRNGCAAAHRLGIRIVRLQDGNDESSRERFKRLG